MFPVVLDMTLKVGNGARYEAESSQSFSRDRSDLCEVRMGRYYVVKVRCIFLGMCSFLSRLCIFYYYHLRNFASPCQMIKYCQIQSRLRLNISEDLYEFHGNIIEIRHIA